MIRWLAVLTGICFGPACAYFLGEQYPDHVIVIWFCLSLWSLVNMIWD